MLPWHKQAKGGGSLLCKQKCTVLILLQLACMLHIKRHCPRLGNKELGMYFLAFLEKGGKGERETVLQDKCICEQPSKSSEQRGSFFFFIFVLHFHFKAIFLSKGSQTFPCADLCGTQKKEKKERKLNYPLKKNILQFIAAAKAAAAPRSISILAFFNTTYKSLYLFCAFQLHRITEYFSSTPHISLALFFNMLQE